MANPFTKNYDCHCGARFATVCRLRHWINGRNHLNSGARSFIIAMLFLTWASGAPNRLNGCKSVDHDTVDSRQLVEDRMATPQPDTQEVIKPPY